MMNYIWGTLMLTGIIWGICTGRADAVAAAMTEGAAAAVELSLSMAGACLMWMGLMNAASRAGLIDRLARRLQKPLGALFPDSPQAVPAITMNFAANFLGLGSAATPFGLEAMAKMSENSPDRTIATRDMVMFIVLNASSIELIPAGVIALRTAAGARDVYCVVLPTFVISVICFFAGILFVRLVWRKAKAPWTR